MVKARKDVVAAPTLPKSNVNVYSSKKHGPHGFAAVLSSSSATLSNMKKNTRDDEVNHPEVKKKRMAQKYINTGLSL